ncbi:DUF4249 family protein [Chitinophagales bacterium]|nr:DUF4249 family protein [Chitinophagales bacterium]
MQSIIQYILLFVLLTLASCEQSSNWDLSTENEHQLIIEAILTDEVAQQELFLSRTFDSLTEEASTVSDAVVSVQVNETNYTFEADQQNPGRYISQDIFGVQSRLDYKLQVALDGQTYSATSQLSEVAPIPEVSFDEQASTGLLQLADFVPLFNPNQQSWYRIEIDWSHLSTESPNEALLHLYTFSSLHISELAPPPKSPIYFPAGSIVTVEKLGLNDDFAAFLRAKAIETDWNGSFFYSAAANPTTNIDGGALGFFSTCSLLRQTLIAE